MSIASTPTCREWVNGLSARFKGARSVPATVHAGLTGETSGFADQLIGEALLDAVVGWRDWCHRRVDSIHPLEGERGRVRHSMDCTPPPDPRLSYLPRERRHRRVDDVHGPIVLPLAIVAKGPMRELNASIADGTPVPLLGMSENVELAVALLEYALRSQGVKVTGSLSNILRIVVGPSASSATVAAELAERGRNGDNQFWNPADVGSDVSDLIRDLGNGFLLSCLLPAANAGIRQVVKLSFHWRIEAAAGGLVQVAFDRLSVGLRFRSRLIELPMTAPSDARSYHLEFQTPPELTCTGLKLPLAAGEQWHPSMVDQTGQPVAHVHGTFARPPGETASVSLGVSSRGLWTYAVLSSFLTAAIMWLAIGLPGAKSALMASSDGAAALLLAVPAVFIGLGAGQKENALAAWMLGPLRVIMFVCALGLLAVAGSVVGVLHEPWCTGLWWAIASFSSLCFGLLVIGRYRR